MEQQRLKSKLKNHGHGSNMTGGSAVRGSLSAMLPKPSVPGTQPAGTLARDATGWCKAKPPCRQANAAPSHYSSAPNRGRSVVRIEQALVSTLSSKTAG
ncbi:hypothetical protein BM221_006996 [Beauveria bassiana]|uniref:Uncharacterized protein n=1 Tax=Beauveria bassiana TaxID=176275 RepID=A0A2N6NJ87_BEABA|nr:hypothetical protein BM221_006996 [Beauveria bassiana]